MYQFHRNDTIMIIHTSTNNFICAYLHESIYHSLLVYLKKYFDVTIKQDTEIEYLNLCTIQTQHGTTFNQTKHIIEIIVNKFFPPENWREINRNPVISVPCTRIKLDLTRYMGWESTILVTEPIEDRTKPVKLMDARERKQVLTETSASEKSLIMISTWIKLLTLKSTTSTTD